MGSQYASNPHFLYSIQRDQRREVRSRKVGLVKPHTRREFYRYRILLAAR